MTITKCDICKKQMQKSERRVGISTSNPWSSIDICEKCGKQVLDFLKKHNLAPKNE